MKLDTKKTIVLHYQVREMINKTEKLFKTIKLKSFYILHNFQAIHLCFRSN